MNRQMTRSEIDRALYRSKPRLTVWDNTPSTSVLETSLGILFVVVICAAIVVLGSVFG